MRHTVYPIFAMAQCSEGVQAAIPTPTIPTATVPTTAIPTKSESTVG